MEMKIVLPTSILLKQMVSKVIFDAQDRSFCLLPRHIDFISALVPSILTFQNLNGIEQYLVHDEGILIKQDREVLVAIKHGLIENSLGSLKNRLEKEFQNIDIQEKKTKQLLTQVVWVAFYDR